MNMTSNTAIDRTEELCQLFSTTLSSLASDASALREIAALESACGLVVEDNDDNSNDVIEGLCHLDEAVAALEGKVQTLTEIVTEEKRSLHELGEIEEAAKAQGRVLDGMLEACHRRLMLQQQQQGGALRNSSVGHETTETKEELRNIVPSRRSLRPSLHSSTSPASESPPSAEAASLPVASARKPLSTRQNRRDSIDPRRLPAKATADRRRQSHHHFCLVTEAELSAVPKTIRGRITLAVVNDALVDIERACLRKQQQRRTRSFNTSQSNDAEQWIVSEQDLRQSCAFFRSGESTARAILLLLRSLKRLKQIPGKHSEVNYVLSGC